MLASSDEQARLIEALLTLASSESRLNRHQPVDLATTVPATLVGLAAETGRLGIHIDTATEPATLDGDPLLVERLVANLLTNAVRHNVAGGRVKVVTGVKDARAVLSVTNTGPLIPPAEVDRLFQPFQRLDRRRATYKDGHGLGLSIVRAIATAHDATIAARPTPDGGLCVSVIFPQPASLAAPPEHHSQKRPAQPRDRAGDTMTRRPGITATARSCCTRAPRRFAWPRTIRHFPAAVRVMMRARLVPVSRSINVAVALRLSRILCAAECGTDSSRGIAEVVDPF